jgi:hypothetical protein
MPSVVDSFAIILCAVRISQGVSMTDRRTLLTAAAAAMASPLANGAPRTAPMPRGGSTSEHWVPGGTRGIQRGQFTYTPTSQIEGYGAIVLPDATHLFMIPLTKTVFDESATVKYQLQGDGVVTVMKDDLYTLTVNMDWPAQPRGSGQDGYDVDMRKLMVLRARVGVAPPRYTPGEVTIVKNSGAYDRVAAHDMPGSSVPYAVRTTVAWNPGTIQPDAMTYKDVTLPAGSFAPDVGDLVRASHDKLTDDLLGAQNVGLLMSARMVAPNVARVVIENRYNSQPVTIPDGGSLNVLAESAVTSAGNNGDSWTYVDSGPTLLLAGEKLFIGVRSSSPGDFLQIDNGSFLRISNVVP